jgi:hypothetical protein
MSTFGFIENFFFISLALVFVLVLLLVYHFKTRITVAEKKSESMYGLLTAVVKEIKTLRGMFGLGETVVSRDEDNANVASVPNVANDSIKSKIIPEVDVSVTSNNTFSDFKEKEKEREVITFEISAKEQDNKIVVSDYESESDDTEYSNDDDEEDDDVDYKGDDDEDDEEDDEDEQHKNETNILPVDVLELEDVKFQELSLQNIEGFSKRIDTAQAVSAENLFRTENELEDQFDIREEDEYVNDTISSILRSANVEEVVLETREPDQDQEETSESKDNMVDLNSISPQTPSIENLKKMNIHQLRTIASQLGITIDITKMKKHELIVLIREVKP